MKAILVIDIPNDYEEYGDWYIIGDDLRIVYEEDGALMHYKYIDDDIAQLKPMPKKSDETSDKISDYDYETAFNDGWNKCIDEILGEEE